MKKIKNIIEELGKATITLKSGKKEIVPTKTIYTYYTDHTNDCRVELQKPLSISGNTEKI